jgi:4-hydroxymandelate oxidase
MIRRAETAGYKVLVFTVDMPGGSNSELSGCYRHLDNRNCRACHTQTDFDKPFTRDIDYHIAKILSWSDLQRIKDITSMKVLEKGIVTAKDASLWMENGADGIIILNHGG